MSCQARPGTARLASGTNRLRPPAVVLLLLPVLLLAVACTANPQQTETLPTAPPPFADCAALSAPPGGTGAAAADNSSVPESSPGVPHSPGDAAAEKGAALPEIELPCFTGGEPVALRGLRGPAVVNLWVAWCLPCRKELPAFQRLAERAGDQVHVIGVNTKDDRGAAQTLAEDLGLTFPTLFDLDEELLRALNVRPFLPVTLFIDESGQIRHLDQSGALDDADLAAAVERHLGVVVPS
ncbi:MAG TPA: TlpA disulfide reductase family protein [Micromonospora sp.]|nr:TlpA disulfide reductase family protein [Micromonospora sp.]